MTFALISILGFMVRGVLAINQHSLLKRKLMRILPHINDTLLLIAALYLVFTLQANPIHHPWLMAKIVALFFYIGLGTLVIKTKGSITQQWICYGLAHMTFAYMVTVAITKSATLGL
jgi:uncharacterized membrane protein SirB2